jgi:hypothetical protein
MEVGHYRQRSDHSVLPQLSRPIGGITGQPDFNSELVPTEPSEFLEARIKS